MGIKNFIKKKMEKKTNDKRNSRHGGTKDFVERMMKAVDRLVDEEVINPVSIEFIKMAMELNLFVSKNDLDEDIFLQNKLEDFVKVMQKYGDDIKGKDAIMLFESLPKVLEGLKIVLKRQERLYESMKKSKEDLFEEFERIEKEK